MIIRLIIPECRNPKKEYCDDAMDITSRLQILEAAMEDRVDLIVTSNNFLDYSGDRNIEESNLPANMDEFIVDFIKRNIIKSINYFSSKIPIILGFDIRRGRKLNPYQGIDAVVCFIDVIEETFLCKTHIWECWKDSYQCNVIKCFEKQKDKRYFSFGGKNIGILSCGDMYTYCNKRNGSSCLNKIDIYIDLAHMSLPAERTINSIKKNLLNYADYVLISQQYKVKEHSKYFKNNNYVLAISNVSNKPQQINLINKNGYVAYFVDLDI